MSEPSQATSAQRTFHPGSSYIHHLLRKADRLEKQACDETQIGRDYRDHAHMQRVVVHQILCLTEGIGHVLCRKGLQTCPVYLDAVHRAETVRKAASREQASDSSGAGEFDV